MCATSSPKPQFASWLIEQVETGQYSGLCFVGQNKFRVPWKHNSRKDCNDEDNKIFRVGPNSSPRCLTSAVIRGNLCQSLGGGWRFRLQHLDTSHGSEVLVKEDH